jgi:hypothetical protein
LSDVPDGPTTVRAAEGVVEPIPRRPFEPKLKSMPPVDEAIVSGLTPFVPLTARVAIGVDVPIPTFPPASIEKYEALDDDATLKIVFEDPEVPRTLKVMVDDVALTPRTVPLSMRVEVPRLVAVSQRVA